MSSDDTKALLPTASWPIWNFLLLNVSLPWASYRRGSPREPLSRTKTLDRSLPDKVNDHRRNFNETPVRHSDACKERLFPWLRGKENLEVCRKRRLIDLEWKNRRFSSHDRLGFYGI